MSSQSWGCHPALHEHNAGATFQAAIFRRVAEIIVGEGLGQCYGGRHDERYNR